MRELSGYQDSLAGISVNEYTALNYSPIWCGVYTLSNDVAKLPLVLYRNLPNGGKERFTSHWLYKILHDEPNPEMTSLKFRETMQALCLLYGNAYAEIVRDDIRRVVGLYPIIPSRVAPIREEKTGLLRYRVTQPSGGQKIMDPANMIHISSLCTDGVLGHSLTAHASESIGLGLATEKFGSAFFGNGSTFGGVVEMPMVLSENTKDNIRTAIEAVHRGVERAHKILVLAGGAKFTQRGTSPNDGQYNETRAFQIAETSRWLRMPPHKLGDYEHAHFDNIELSNLDYWRGCVAGWLKMWEQELSRKLISPLEYTQQTIAFNMEGELRGDSAARAAFYTSMFQIGVFSQNDILRLENMNPIPDGDVHFVPLNMIPVERLDEYITKKLLAEPAKPQLSDGGDNQKKVDEAERALVVAQAERDAARQAATEHETKLAAKVAEFETAIHQLETAGAAVAAHIAEGLANSERADVASQGREAAILEAEAAKREAVTLNAAVVAAQTALNEARTERQELETQAAVSSDALKSAETLVLEKAGEVEQAKAQIMAAEARIAEEVGKTTAAEQAAEALRAAAAATAAELAERTAALATANTTLADVRSSLTITEAAVQERRTAERTRLTNVIGAHRALIVDVIQRAIRPEIERARRHQKTSESLQRWAAAFYQTHRDVCSEMFWPAMTTHLAWKQSTDDAREAARQLAHEHCEESERQLRVVIEGSDPEEFHAQLERTLARWEQERPQIVADKVLHDELTYLNSLQ